MVVGQFTQETHLAVIGGGVAGLTAAVRAAELGVQTTVARDGAGPAPPSDLEKRCRELDVEIVEGHAAFEDARQIIVSAGTNARLRFKRAVIATGARPAPPPGGWPESKRVTDWLGAQQLDAVPKTLLVLGGGPVALEVAQAWAARGSAVSLATPDVRLLPEADPEIVMPLRERLVETLDAVCFGAAVSKLRELPDGVEVDFVEGDHSWRRGFDHVIVALGHRPHTDGLDLSRAKIDLDDDHAVTVDAQLRTSNPRIFAAGGVTGAPFVVAHAVAQARVAAEVIAGGNSVYEPQAMPHIVSTDPPLAWCGLTEAAATAPGLPHRVALAGGTGCDIRIAKLIYDPDSGSILGAGLVGPGAVDAIAEAVLAIEMGAVTTDLAATVHPFGTMSALLAEASRLD